jgi:hypothetical protein
MVLPVEYTQVECTGQHNIKSGMADQVQGQRRYLKLIFELFERNWIIQM